MSRTTTIEQQPTTNSQPPPNEMYVNMYTIFFSATLPYIRALISRVAEENDKTMKNLRFLPPQGHRAGEGAKGFLLDTTTSTMFKKKKYKSIKKPSAFNHSAAAEGGKLYSVEKHIARNRYICRNSAPGPFVFRSSLSPLCPYCPLLFRQARKRGGEWRGRKWMTSPL